MLEMRESHGVSDAITDESFVSFYANFGQSTFEKSLIVVVGTDVSATDNCLIRSQNTTKLNEKKKRIWILVHCGRKFNDWFGRKVFPAKKWSLNKKKKKINCLRNNSVCRNDHRQKPVNGETARDDVRSESYMSTVSFTLLHRPYACVRHLLGV